MEHQRCYVYEPSGTEERPSKRLRTTESGPYVHLTGRLDTYRELWARQEERIQVNMLHPSE